MLMQCLPYPGDMWETSIIGVGGWTSNVIDTDAMAKQAREGNMDAATAVKAAKAMGSRVVVMASIVNSGLKANQDILREQPLYKPLSNRLDGKDWAEKLLLK
jgi:hypothetical protein